ncbi:uncharacterized protein LOC128546105 [Mercenaria mercenaria]|uniref:uncharacterized protein LOC128546105 n=1 Tax=Mercenaria mercenaria TaxID=6596 RepID=UPI00234EAD23|nr:uncharacterized protein LOC128546105 [Mercenaria mercenaria]
MDTSDRSSYDDRWGMENSRIQAMIDDRMKASLEEHKTSMLTDMEKMLEKISGNSNFEQMNKISSILKGTQTFKRKSNEEQFKYNSKVSIALDEADHLIQSNKLQESRQKIAEAKEMISHRQKLIRLADSSELGWRVVNEYESNPLASDSDDEKRIYKAETRANKKLKAEKAKRTRGSRSWPYRKPTTASAGNVQVSNATQQTPRRPGLCFARGKPGHWKGSSECSANSSNNKISSFISNNFQNENLFRIKDPDISFSQSNNVVKESDVITEKSSTEQSSPVGRLKQNLSKWREASDSTFILNVVEKGYKLPFMSVPDSVVLKNNKTARENSCFVEQEIENLLLKGIVSEIDSIPYVVNPLTVAYNRNGKPRLVLDCRHINPFLHQFNVKFEDIKVAETLFDKNSFLFTFDLKGAYHHIDIFPEHRTYLGFSYSRSGHTKYYVYNSLPFGIKTAGHIFTKLLKVVVTFLRATGHKIIMFLDDGIGGHSDYEKALRSSEFTMQTLVALAFYLLTKSVIGYRH